MHARQGVVFLLLLLCGFAQANDSSWGDVNGSIKLMKQSDISMAKERLSISTERINVDYLFVNHGQQDVVLPMAFPMPEIIQNQGEDRTPGISNFKLSVNGKTVETESRWVVTLHDKQTGQTEDITEKMLQSGWEIPKLRQALRNYGSFAYGDGKNMPHVSAELFDEDGIPRFTVRQLFLWQQAFPAGKEVIIQHSYTPSVSTGVPTGYKWTPGDGTKDNEGNKCLSRTNLEQLKKLTATIPKQNSDSDYIDVDWEQLDYILTTGANWRNGVIEDFTLRIHKNAPDDVVVTCFKHPLTQVDPLTLEFKQQNFKPENDLSITFHSNPWGK
ncbi:DUF4424 family protein [Serratia sp. DD3]|uniref:DUF4424 family protein n=1 Tax=Serratia sp. DD3 TaxID=1410619 RepID=UPI0003C51E91|nr:DUF4424 family protein [Serratia sp. DD3]KEY57929.1 hypothetical protein SRDD_30540 [Serratia sp. DD3]